MRDAEGNPKNVWQVVGGNASGGLLVRKGQNLDSEKLLDRLSQGALIAEIDLLDGRLHYDLICGEGPQSGWVSVKVAGKQLVTLSSEDAILAAAEQARLKELATEEAEEAQKKAEQARCRELAIKEARTQVLEAGDIVEVVGNETMGGLAVWSTEKISATRVGTLSSGELIQIKKLSGKRIYYEKLQGAGPPNGWANSVFDGEPMVIKKLLNPIEFAKADPNEVGYSIDADVSSSELGSASESQANELLNMYAKQFGCSDEGDEEPCLGQNQKDFSFRCSGKTYCNDPEAVLCQLGNELKAVTKEKAKTSRVGINKDWVRDSDGDMVQLCGRCNLPVGDLVYESSPVSNAMRDFTCLKLSSSLMHAECMAQECLQKLQNEECARLCKAKATKQKHRAEYEIGWKVSQIPRSVEAAAKLKLSSVPAGMCCLVWNPDTNTVSLAATLEPAASINLEYLSLALQVRMRTGHEPWFSLNPWNPGDGKSMQQKMFDPDWLQGTSLGEVMFQADYHLKELSMGEYDQPVVGMKSCFDFVAEDPKEKERAWNGREWFVVNKCEVQLSDDNVVVPYLKMGVQAREMKLNPKTEKMEDLPVTHRTNPMVQYAEQFTHNFDLIAERKSVINQLREVAKATIVAKFLMDSKVHLESEWFSLNEEVKPNSCVMELPQLWNMHGASTIQVKDGKIVDVHKGFATEIHSIYGGVEFGVDKFRLATPSMSRAYPTLGVPGGRVAPLTSGFPAAGMQAISATLLRPPAGVLGASMGRPQGVDLSLRKFDLSAPSQLTGQMRACSASLESAEAKVPIGSTFLEQLKTGFIRSSFDEPHIALLQKIFNPNLCDRHNEGSLFTPPDTRIEYVRNLEQLIREETDALSQRVSTFSSTDFKMETPGREFPPSWTSAYELLRGEGEGELSSGTVIGSLQPGQLQVRTDYKSQAWVFEDFVLKNHVPVFDKTTEEGARFRIYRIGSIEVRTIQEFGKEETVAVVMSIQLSNKTNVAKEEKVKDEEELAKITHFVEQIPIDTPSAEDQKRDQHRFYVVVETAIGNVIVTEKLDHSTVTFQENPRDLAIRNSLAKTVCSEELSGTTVLDLRNFKAKELQERSLTCKKYAEGVVDKMLGRDPQQKQKKQISSKMSSHPLDSTGNLSKEKRSGRPNAYSPGYVSKAYTPLGGNLAGSRVKSLFRG